MTRSRDYIKCKWESINKLLGGGLRRGTTCLLEELSGESRGVSGRLGVSFLMTGLKQGEGAIILLSEHTVKEYYHLPPIETLISLAKPGHLIFMDGLSSISFTEPTTPPEKGVVRCSNIRYAAKFYEELRSTVEPFDQVRMYIDSLSVLLHSMENDKVAWQFWLALLPLIRQRKLTVIASFYPEMHSSRFAESIERVSDCILRFSTPSATPGEKPTRLIQVVKNRGLDYDENLYPYTREEYDFILRTDM